MKNNNKTQKNKKNEYEEVQKIEEIDDISTTTKKTDFLLKLFIRSYLFRKKELYNNIKLLKSYYKEKDGDDDIDADSFNTAVTTSILDVHESLMKNDELFIKFTEMMYKHDSEGFIDSKISDSAFDIDDNMEEDDYDMESIKKELEFIK